MNAPKRILIVNPFGIGDVLFSTPLIRAVRRAFPDAHLAYLCNRRTEEILRGNPHVTELFVYERDEAVAAWKRHKPTAVKMVMSLVTAVRRRRFDLAIDLSLGERYSFLLALLGVRRRVGFDYRRRGKFLTHRMVIDGYQDEHVVRYYAKLLRRLGIVMLDESMELPTSDEDRRQAQRQVQLECRPGQRLIGLIPAGGVSWGLQAQFRRWPKEGFIRVGSVLSQRHGAKIVIFGEMADEAVCAEIAEAIGPAAVNLAGGTTLGQFVSLIGCCDLVISSDGGPVHIAASQHIPTVSIFGPVDPTVYGPHPLTSEHRMVYREDLPCRPCYHRFRLPPCPYDRACLRDLHAEDILLACESLLTANATA